MGFRDHTLEAQHRSMGDGIGKKRNLLLSYRGSNSLEVRRAGNDNAGLLLSDPSASAKQGTFP